MGVTWDDKRKARQQDLYEYLVKHHRSEFESDGSSLRLLANKSISIKKGYAGFKDFGNGRTGNGIDFLMEYLNYSFVDAVNALNTESEAAIKDPDPRKKKQYYVPQKAAGNKRIISYLSVERRIDKGFIEWLIGKGVLYQDIYSNCVFMSPKKDFYEQRGIFDTPYHRNADLSPDNTRYWYFNSPSAKALTKAFICESAIDAMSLYLLHPDDGYYFSIAGVGNQQRIDAIKTLGLQTITAFDNDEAGQEGRNRNNDLKHIIPSCKDWNEQLQKGKTQ